MLFYQTVALLALFGEFLSEKILVSELIVIVLTKVHILSRLNIQVDLFNLALDDSILMSFSNGVNHPNNLHRVPTDNYQDDNNVVSLQDFIFFLIGRKDQESQSDSEHTKNEQVDLPQQRVGQTT